MINLNHMEAVSPFSAEADGDRFSSSRILVVDDDDIFREFLVAIVARLGCQIDIAHDGEAGWDAFQLAHYDLLLTDHKMPRLLGLDLIRRVRSVRRNMPCILMSSELPTHEVDLAALTKPGAAIEKAFSLPSLLPKIRELLRFGQGVSAGREPSVQHAAG